MTAGDARESPAAELRLGQDVAVGLVGPHALVERIVLAAGLPGPAHRNLRLSNGESGADGMRCRLLLAAYADEQEAPEKAARLGSADAFLFANRAPLEYARRAGVLDGAAVDIDVADGPLIGALLRVRQAGADPGRASFDTVTRPEAARALAELGLSAHRIHVQDKIASPAAMASHHARLWQLGQTSTAITCLDAVARRLTAAGVPVVPVVPSDQAIAAALREAVLLAERRALMAAQLAVAVVEVPDLHGAGARAAPRQARDELRLAVHGFLVRMARRLSATVSPVSEHGFLLVASACSLAAAATEELSLTVQAERELGVVLEVGFGTGRTEREAEEAATRQLAMSGGRVGTGRRRSTGAIEPGATRPGTAHRRAGLPDRAVRRLHPAPGLALAAEPALASAPVSGLAPGAPATPGPPEAAAPSNPARTLPDRTLPDRTLLDTTLPDPAGRSLSRLRSLETLARLAQKLAADATPVVDAELTGRLLSVTPRTARRQLRALADEGLALPLPPRRTQHPGRPRQSYRLVVEQLGRPAAR
jgi:hypothetical protein